MPWAPGWAPGAGGSYPWAFRSHLGRGGVRVLAQEWVRQTQLGREVSELEGRRFLRGIRRDLTFAVQRCKRDGEAIVSEVDPDFRTSA